LGHKVFLSSPSRNSLLLASTTLSLDHYISKGTVQGRAALCPAWRSPTQQVSPSGAFALPNDPNGRIVFQNKSSFWSNLIRRVANNRYYSDVAIKTESEEPSLLKRPREEPSEKSGLKRQKLSHDASGSIDDHSLQLILAQATAAAQQESAPVSNREGSYQGHISSPASQQSHPTGGSYEWDAKLQMRISSLPMLESLVRTSINLRSIYTRSQYQSIEKLS
jgi:hypothetical protein